VIAAPTFGVSVTAADAITDLTDRRLQRLFVNLCFPLSPAAWPCQAGGIAFCAGVLSPIATSAAAIVDSGRLLCANSGQSPTPRRIRSTGNSHTSEPSTGADQNL
jgi:hypothetical protein